MWQAIATVTAMDVLVLGGIFVVWAIVLLSFGAGGVLVVRRTMRDMDRSRHLDMVSRHTTGTVMDNQMRSHSGGPHSSGYVRFHPVIRYLTDDQREIVCVGPIGSRQSFLVGTTVPIRYDPGDPQHVEVTGGEGSRTTNWGCGIALGIALLLVAVAVALGACAVVLQQSRW